jgi:hypothetical protein
MAAAVALHMSCDGARLTGFSLLNTQQDRYDESRRLLMGLCYLHAHVPQGRIAAACGLKTTSQVSTAVTWLRNRLTVGARSAAAGGAGDPLAPLCQSITQTYTRMVPRALRV